MRVFSEAEIAQILQRAADRQAEATQATPTTGLSLAEIEALAAEAGLDVAHVRAAAAELAPASPAVRSRSATHVFVERTVEAPLTDAGWDEAVAELRNRFGKAGLAAFSPGAAPSGDVVVTGRTREWSHTDGLGVETRVLVTDRGGATRLRLSQRVGTMREAGDGVLVGLPIGLLLGAAAAAALPGPNAVVVGAVVLLSIVLTWWADRAWRRTMHDRLDGLSETVAGLLAAHGPAEATTDAVRAPALSLDALGDAPAERDPARASDSHRLPGG